MRLRVLVPLLILISSLALAEQGVEKKWSVIRGVGVHYVVVDPSLTRLEAIFPDATSPKKKRFARERFSHLVGKTQPLAAINGTYFDLSSGRPVGGLIRNGEVIFGGLGHSSIVVRTSGQVEIKKDPKCGGLEYQVWDQSVRLAIGTGPILVSRGKVEKNMRDEGYGDPAIFGKSRRSAFGLTKASKPVLLSISGPTSLKKLACVMVDLGIQEAVNLDGGGSSSLYCGEKYFIQSSRPIPQMIAIFQRETTAP